MKICIAQTKPIKGDISANIEAHLRFIALALTLNADAIFFPELSLTGYEPELAKKLATNQNDHRLDIFQQICDNKKIIIGLGLPTENESYIRISMIFFEPNKPRQTYSKQQMIDEKFYSGAKGIYKKFKKGKPYSGRLREDDGEYKIIGCCKKGVPCGKFIIFKSDNELIWKGVIYKMGSI